MKAASRNPPALVVLHFDLSFADFGEHFCFLQMVGLLLIAVAAWGKGFGLVSSIHIIGGVIAVGVFLLLISIVGLIGAIHHHQVMLFFVSLLYATKKPPVVSEFPHYSFTLQRICHFFHGLQIYNFKIPGKK